MSRKQELYLEILRWALPSARNGLSPFMRIRPFVLLSNRRQRSLHANYEIAQLVHSLYGSVLEEAFTDHDMWFLNVHARSFIERNNDQNCFHYSLYAYYIQELYRAVPDEMRHRLEWPGPTGDYEWARPKLGSEQ